MLEAIRRHAQGWLAKAILALIAVTFAVFGLETYLQGDRSGGAVAEVGEVGIGREALSEEIRTQTEQRREALGQAFDPAVAETKAFRQEVLDSMIERSAMLQDAQKLGLFAPDSHVAAMLAQIPAFQEDGKFSQSRYETILRQNRRTPLQFENELRQRFMLEAMASPVVLASFSSREASAQIARLVAQQREISWVDIPAASVAGEIKITPADVERYYTANKAEFTEPEQIRAEYAILDAAAMTAGIAISDQQIAEYYASHAGEFGQPEQRSASHILIAAEAGSAADARAQARAKAETLYQTLLKSPARFSELARAESQDPGSASQGGSLGSFPRGAMVKPFEDAVFSMKPGEIRGPVESDFGYHVIRLDGIQAAETIPLSEVRPAIVDVLRKELAQKRFADMADTFGNLVYESANSFQPAATATKAVVKETGWVAAVTAPEPFNHPELAQALFSADAIKGRQNTEAFEVKPGMLVAARVIDHRQARLKPLPEVSQMIEARLRGEESTKLLARKGETTIQSLTKGEEPPLAWSAFKVVGRQPSEVLDAAGAKVVFRTRTDKLPAYAGFQRADGAYRIVRIVRVLEAGDVDPMLAASIEAGIAQTQQRTDLQAMLALVKAGYKVNIRPDAIEGR